jgi:N-acetylglucosamine-6-phosphate deacetylase
VIADGEHLSPELLRFAWQFKGAERLCLVTDANRAVDLPAGEYRFGPVEEGSWFESNGRVGFVRGAGLASSVHGLDTMVQVMHKATGAPLNEVIRMATLTPAERAGVDRLCGSLQQGKFADLLVLDSRLRVQRVFIGGVETRYKRQQA